MEGWGLGGGSECQNLTETLTKTEMGSTCGALKPMSSGEPYRKVVRIELKMDNSPREIMGEDSCETSSYQEPPRSEGGDMGEAKRDAACAVATRCRRSGK